jgi:hypothetical protein
LVGLLNEFAGYIRASTAWIPNYGERHRCGEAISSAFVESTVNQVVSKRMVKKQQMRWTPRGAHLLLQIRARVLNDTSQRTTDAGTSTSPTPPITRRWQHSLPRFFLVSLTFSALHGQEARFVVGRGVLVLAICWSMSSWMMSRRVRASAATSGSRMMVSWLS